MVPCQTPLGQAATNPAHDLPAGHALVLLSKGGMGGLLAGGFTHRPKFVKWLLPVWIDGGAITTVGWCSLSA